jgi:hypothetical protein
MACAGVVDGKTDPEGPQMLAAPAERGEVVDRL